MAGTRPALAEQRQWPGVVASYAKAIALEPGTSGSWVERAHAHAEMGQWRRAAADFAHVLRSGVATEDWFVSHEAAMAQLGSGDADGYRDLCARMLARFGQTKPPMILPAT